MHCYDVVTDVQYQNTIPFVNGHLQRAQLIFIIYPIAFLLLAILDALCHKNYMKVRRWAYFLVGGANLYCLNHEDEV